LPLRQKLVASHCRVKRKSFKMLQLLHQLMMTMLCR